MLYRVIEDFNAGAAADIYRRTRDRQSLASLQLSKYCFNHLDTVGVQANCSTAAIDIYAFENQLCF